MATLTLEPDRPADHAETAPPGAVAYEPARHELPTELPVLGPGAAQTCPECRAPLVWLTGSTLGCPGCDFAAWPE